MPVDNNTPFVDEHEAVGKDPQKTPTKPISAKDQALIKKVQALWTKSKKKRSLYDYNWLEFYKFFRGVQWNTDRPSYRHSEVINMVFQTIQSQVPTMMDVRPKVEFKPSDPTDREYADVMNNLFKADWEKNKWLNVTTEVVYDGHFYGAAFSEMGFNPDANLGDGKIIYKSIDPFYVFPEPDTEQINADDVDAAQSFQIVQPKDWKRLKQQYPRHANQIKPDMIDLNGTNNRANLGEVRFRSPVNNNIEHYEHSETGDLSHIDKSLVITTYLKSKDLTEEPFTDPDGKRKFRQKLKHPKGRKVVVAGGAVVEDNDELPYDDLKFPYSKYTNYILPREFWGVSEVEPIASPQRIFNKLVSFALDVLTITGNPVWVIDTSSGIDPESIYNRPGLIIEKEQGSEVRREAGVQLQPFVIQLIDRMEQWFNQAAGEADVSRGIAPASVTANAAIENLMDASQTRIRQKMRNLDNYLVDVGQQYASRVMQFYTKDRVFRLTNNDGSLQFFRFRVDQDEEGNKVGVISDFEQVDNELVEGEPRQFQIQSELDVIATTGTGLPFAKAEKEQRLLQLFDRQIIDAEEVLTAMDYPNAEKVLARVAEQQQAAAEAAAAQGQA